MVLEFVIHSLESRNDERRSDDVSQIRSRIEYLMSLLAAEHFRLLALGCGMPASGGYVGTVSGELPHSTRDVSVYGIIS